ncbi:MAG: cache domain-containing protein, partial [Elusimicrobia bacterium]|nr:cache domain-containing protein [Elusimicrobiota bacterium]
MIKLHSPKKLSWKLFVAIIPPVILAVGGVVWLQYHRARREMLGSIDTEMGLLAQRTASSVDDLLAERYRDLATLAETPLIADYYRNVDFGLRDEAESYRKELERYLRRFSARGRVYAHILYLNADGRVVCRVDGASSRSSEATAFTPADFLAASKLSAGKRWISGVRGLPGGGRVLYFAQPIRDELGALKGLLVLGYDLNQLHRLLSSIAVGESGGAFIRTDQNGGITGRGG